MKKERLVIRIEKIKRFYEYGKPLLIFIDEVCEPYKNVVYAACTGHGEGNYNALIQQSRPITKEELANFNGEIYGYNLNDFNIVKKRIFTK